MIHSLRVPPPHLLDQLLLGATLFKIGLVILGLVVIAYARCTWRSGPESPALTSASRGKYILVILAAILFAAGALRLYRLDSGLWHDEIVTYVKYAKIPFGEILSTYDSGLPYTEAAPCRAVILTTCPSLVPS